MKQQNVFIIVLICALSDALLISLGVSGGHLLIHSLPWLEIAARYGGAVFLLAYGAISFYSAFTQSHGLHVDDQKKVSSISTVIMICLGFTWLNPHVYLDTLVLIGSISSQYPTQKLQFGCGAVTASFIFFFALGYGARFLRPFFCKTLLMESA